MKQPLLVAATVVGGIAIVGASASTLANPPTAPVGPPTHEFKAHGLSIAQDAKAEVEEREDGSVRQVQTTQVRLKGHGPRTMTAVVEDAPVSLGGTQKATITDGEGGRTTEFSYSPATNGITITTGENSAVVVRNPDQSYSVDGEAAADGKAAVALLQDKSAWTDASPHAIMMAYAFAHAPNAAIKNTQNCDLPSCMEMGQAATPPAVCTLFEDFCECAACDKVSNGRACATCE